MGKLNHLQHLLNQLQFRLLSKNNQHHSKLKHNLLLDYFDLKERFKTFAGLNTKELRIESGFERLNTHTLNHVTGLKESWNLKINNRKMLSSLENIEEDDKRQNKLEK